MRQDKIIKYIFEDNLFNSNFCYFDKPIFPYNKQQRWGLLVGKYSKFELKKIEQLIDEYLQIPKIEFNTSFDGKLITIILADCFRIEYYKRKSNLYASIFFNGKKLPKVFDTIEDAKEYILNNYPRLILNKKHLIF